MSSEQGMGADHDAHSDDFGGSGTGQAGGHGARQDFSATQQRQGALGRSGQQGDLAQSDTARTGLGKSELGQNGMGKSEIKSGLGTKGQRADYSASSQLDDPSTGISAGNQASVGTGDKFAPRGQTGAGYAGDDEDLGAGGGTQQYGQSGTTAAGKTGKVSAGDKILGGYISFPPLFPVGFGAYEVFQADLRRLQER